MKTPEQQNNQEEIKNAESQDEEIIPQKYKGMPSELVEEIWADPEFRIINPELKKSEIERRKNAIEAIKKSEQERESKKEEYLKQRYLDLNKSQQAEFPKAQQESAKILSEYISGKKELKDLSTEESFVLNKLQTSYQEFKEKNPDKPFSFDFAKELDRKIYTNLIQKTAFEVIENKQTVKDQEKANSIREKIGIPLQEIKVPELLSSTEEQKKSESKENFEILDINNFDSIKSFARKETLESQSSYEESLDKVLETLKENRGIEEIKNTNIPTIVLSDLHARRDFLINTLEKKMPNGKTVYESLLQGEINIVCVGDGMHSEKLENWEAGDSWIYNLNEKRNDVSADLKIKIDEYKKILEKITGKQYEKLTPYEIAKTKQETEAKAKWSEVEFEIKKPEFKKTIMQQEMKKSLGTMKMVMELKTNFPEVFHYVRGNHDDIKESITQFKKFDNESEDVKNWIIDNFGQEFLDKYAKFENSLPLIIKGKDFVVSHAAPSEIFTKDQINQKDKKIIRGLTWTDNIKGESSEDVVVQTLKNLDAENSKWIIGHRLVKDKYREEFNGKLIQICHEKKQLVAVLNPDSSFDPEKDVYDVKS